jgi:hypothetical protein
MHRCNKTGNIQYVQPNTDARSCHHCYRRRTISIKYSECMFVALLIQHEMRMLHSLLLSVACLAVPYFSNNRSLLGQTRVFL